MHHNTILEYRVRPGHLVELTLPVDLLDVAIHFHGQSITTLRPSTLEHPPSIRGRHASSEAMGPQTTPDFWLISTFWHTNSLSN
jgi:hypothetical protein